MSPEPRLSRVDSAERTARWLIEVARAAFAGRGFAKVSMDELAAQAGVTRGALHHHFTNKSGLFEAVLMKVNDELESELEARWNLERQRCHHSRSVTLSVAQVHVAGV